MDGVDLSTPNLIVTVSNAPPHNINANLTVNHKAISVAMERTMASIALMTIFVSEPAAALENYPDTSTSTSAGACGSSTADCALVAFALC